MRRHFAFLVLLLGAMLLAACGERVPTAEEITQSLERTRASTQSAHAVVDIQFSSAEQTGNMTVEGWMERTGATDAEGQPIARMRGEVLAASDAELLGSLVVSDGQTFWLYSPSANTAVTGTVDELKDQGPTSPIGATKMLQDLIQQGLDAVELKPISSEQVNGTDTWKVEFSPNAETSAQLQLDALIQGTMWVDKALELPIKLELDASDFGQGSLNVNKIELNVDLPDELFSFTPPPGTTIKQAAELAAQMQPKAASLDEARTSVSFVLREPSYLPSGLALTEVRVLGTSTVILNYSGEGGSLSLVQSNEEVGRDREPPVGSEVSTVTVGEAEGTLITGGDGQGSLLRWEQNGVRYVVAGTIAGDEAQKVAESLK